MTMITPSYLGDTIGESLHACRSTLEDLLVIWIKNTHRSEIQRKRGGKGGKLSNSGGRPKGSFNINSYNFKKRMGVFRC